MVEDRLETKPQFRELESKSYTFYGPPPYLISLPLWKDHLPKGASDMHYQFGEMASTTLSLYWVIMPVTSTHLEFILLSIARNSPSTFNYRLNAKNQVVKFWIGLSSTLKMFINFHRRCPFQTKRHIQKASDSYQRYGHRHCSDSKTLQ